MRCIIGKNPGTGKIIKQKKGKIGMKALKITTLIICGVILLSGCNRIRKPGSRFNDFDLPSDPVVFSEELDENMRAMSVTVNGRTYTDFGDLKEDDSEYSIKECLGYLKDYERRRVYTLTEDPNDNYILIKNLNSLTGDTRFFRANDTLHKDIYTPEYISSLGFECWCDSGLHHEMKEAQVSFILDAEDIKSVGYCFNINGKVACSGASEYADSSPFEKGKMLTVSITEYELAQIAELDKPFTVELTFTVTGTDGIEHKVEGSYNREMMLGAYLCSLSIEQDNAGGYVLEEDI